MEEPDEDKDMYWRDKRVSSRLSFALEHDKQYKDVEFLVGDKEVRIPAHKLILRLSSLVFENLITAHEEQGLREIRLPNTTPDMFTRLLKFVYTDEMEIHDMMNFLEVAREFGFSKLTEQTLRALKKTKFDQDNVSYILDIAKALGNKELETSSINYIFSHAKKVLNSPSFVKLSYLGLCQILLEDKLDVAEIEVFKASIRWAEHQCKRAKVIASSENLRKYLKDARLYIRYTQMDYEKVQSEVKPSGIFLKEEFAHILNCFLDSSTFNRLGLILEPRATRASKLQKLMSLPIENNKIEETPKKKKKLSPEPAKDRTKEFRMYSTQIDFRDLINSINLRYTVTKIVLHEVIILDALCYGRRRVYLPNLETFYYCLKKEDPTLVTPCLLPDKNFLCGLSTRDFLFFEKDQLNTWDLKDLWGMGVDILIHVKGLRLLDINHQNKALTISFPVPSEACEILQSLINETELNSICLTASNLADQECMWVSLPDALTSTAAKLTTLVLQGVEFKNSSDAKFIINQFPNLKNLSFYIVNPISLNFEVDFTYQRTSLERITFSNVNFTTYKKKKDVVPFLLCEELYLDVCSWPPALGDHISLLFPKLRKIAIRSRSTCRCSARLFTEILEIRGIRSIAMYRYPEIEVNTSLVSPNLNIFLPPQGVNKSAVKRFLTKAGLVFSETNPDVPDFILKKNIDNGRWSVVPDLDNSLFDKMHFEYSMLDRFYDDPHVTKLVQ